MAGRSGNSGRKNLEDFPFLFTFQKVTEMATSFVKNKHWDDNYKRSAVNFFQEDTALVRPVTTL